MFLGARIKVLDFLSWKHADPNAQRSGVQGQFIGKRDLTHPTALPHRLNATRLSVRPLLGVVECLGCVALVAVIHRGLFFRLRLERFPVEGADVVVAPGSVHDPLHVLRIAIHGKRE